ncbi:MAG: hypothetical protein ACI9K1_000352 [Arcticibacterium sp.]|jgi:hypothetical protein
MKPIYFFLLFGCVLSLLFSSGQVENPDTHLRLTQTRLLLQDHRFGLPEDVGEDFHGNIAINEKGQRHMVYNPGQTLFFVPIYYFSTLFSSNDVTQYYFSAYCVSFINYFIHALSAFFLFRIALLIGAEEKSAYLLSAFFGLTSYSFVFAQSTYEHHFEMLFILMSMSSALQENSRRPSLTSGLILSLSLVFRSTAILALPAILLMQKERTAKIRTLVGVLPGVVFLLIYNYFRFDNFFESGYSLAWTLAHGDKLDFWSVSRLPLGFLGLIFSPGKGLIFFSTTLVVSLFGLRQFWLKNKLMFCSILLLSAIYLGVFSVNFAWHGSIWSFGPRYILPILPFLYLPIIYLKPKRWVITTIIVGFLMQIVLISVNYKRAVLEDYVRNNGLADNEYVFSFDKNPLLVQVKQLFVILPKNSEVLRNYQPNSPWKKEIRTASNEEVLISSIEKNSINFWWARIFHWQHSAVVKSLTVFLVFIALLGFIKLSQYARTKIL